MKFCFTACPRKIKQTYPASFIVESYTRLFANSKLRSVGDKCAQVDFRHCNLSFSYRWMFANGLIYVAVIELGAAMSPSSTTNSQFISLRHASLNRSKTPEKLLVKIAWFISAGAESIHAMTSPLLRSRHVSGLLTFPWLPAKISASRCSFRGLGI